MKKAISMAMAAAMVLSTGVTTVPVMADEKAELTIWSPQIKKRSRPGGRKRLQNGMRQIRTSR